MEGDGRERPCEKGATSALTSLPGHPPLDPRPRQQIQQRPRRALQQRANPDRPVRAPKANAIAERFVRTVRAECLDWLLILNRRHLERVLRVYVDHATHQRTHRALKLTTPQPNTPPPTTLEIHRRDRLGGLIHEYYRAAA